MAVGDTKKIKTKGRIVTFRQVKDSGFGMWRIVSNMPTHEAKLSRVV